MSTTFFVASLKCPHCGAVSPADTSTQMTSRLSQQPGTTVYRVGDTVAAGPGDFDWSYITVRRPPPGEAIRVLEHWTCPARGEENWAMVVIEGGRVEGVEVIDLSRTTLLKANFVTEKVEEIFERLVGHSPWEGTEQVADFATLLSQRLPES